MLGSIFVSQLSIRCHSRFRLSFSRLYCHVPNLSGWDKKQSLSLEMKVEYERLWKQHVDNFSYKENESRPNTYILSMFPYPSGNLHMGHVRVYTISDTLARFYRMKGHNVLHPMGWDAFGLPAENAALQNGEDPVAWTEKNICIMRSQLKQLGCSFDWDREFATCDPNYYKWTQFIFIEMYKAGLVYRKPALVNWDPIDKTVLADEQIDENGNSWRSGAKAEKKLLTQWFVRSTKFSSTLLKELKNFSKDDWADVVNLQRSWIGEVDGTVFDWIIEGGAFTIPLPIYTANPEHVLKVGFIAVKPESMLDVMQDKNNSITYEYKTKDGDLASFQARKLDLVAKNPFTQENVPIYVVDGILPFPEKSDTYMGVPSVVDIDSIFTNTVGLKMENPSNNNVQNTSSEALCSKAQEMGFGGHPTSSALKDWLISRQRYWGTPIPIIHCIACGSVPVPEDQLPVTLPPYPSKKASTDAIASPLAQAEEWVNTTCPKCGGSATRETDTMDTFVDSSWYYLRFLDPSNDQALVGFEKTKQFMPVDVYIGGKEHATLHLYYARIVSHFLHQIGISSSPEPFQRLLVQGMVMGQTFIEEETGRYLKRAEVEFRGKDAFSKETGKSVIMKWDKMSKSKHNGVDPADAIGSFGVDTTRLLMLADAAPFSQRNWDPEGSKGVLSWQNNLYMLTSHFISIREAANNGELTHDKSSPVYLKGEEEVYDLRNKMLSVITQSYKHTHQFMVAIKSMQSSTKKLKQFPPEIVAFGPQFELALATLIVSVAPMAPHFASELWRGFLLAPGRLNTKSTEIKWDKPVLKQSWPRLDDEFQLPFSVSINGRDVLTTTMSYSKLKKLNEDELLQIALQQDKIKKLLGNKTIKSHTSSVRYERGALVRISVDGVKVNKEDTIDTFSKKGRQALAKKKKKEEVSA